MNLISYLKAYRAEHGLTQHELAALLGVNNQTMWCWETGKTFPHTGKSRAVISKVTGYNDWNDPANKTSMKLVRYVRDHLNDMSAETMAKKGGFNIDDIHRCMFEIVGERREKLTTNGHQNICWFCEHAVPSPEKGTGCSWSRRLQPVKGWTADLTHHDWGVTWHITDCPEFKSDYKGGIEDEL